jgi:hypothetical protein
LNCKKGQVTFGASFSSFSHFDGKEYLKRNIITHLGDLITNLKVNEIENGIVFPKFVTGDFKLYLPGSADFSKLVYPDFIFGEIELLPANKKILLE